MHAVYRRATLLAVGFACISTAVLAADAVILNDGFVIQGRATRENNPFGYGFDVVDDGPKIVVFSGHTKKGAKVEKDVSRPDYVGYDLPFPGALGKKTPSYGEMKIGDFDEKWKRSIRINYEGGGWTEVKQMITHLDPYFLRVPSTSHRRMDGNIWTVSYHTSEFEPKQIRKLLSTHPSLKEEAGKPDPAKRVAIASFLKDVGWLTYAREEFEQAKKDIPGEWSKEAADKAVTFQTELDLAETRAKLDKIEAWIGAGRYETVRRELADFSPKATDQKETTRLAVLKAQVDTIQPKFEETRRLLDELIHREDGGIARESAVVAGGAVVPVVPRPKVEGNLTPLLAAAEVVLSELHPDTANRLELFANLARQADQRRRDGKDPGTKSAELLALAITGWTKGKNGADPNPATAIGCWTAREFAMSFLREDKPNARAGLLANYGKTAPIPTDELVQVISLLPPPMPHDLTQPLGVEAPKAEAAVRGVFKRTTPVEPGGPEPVDYFLRLPPEYHHGRSYPVIIALSNLPIPAEKMIGGLADYADRFGYIVAAPVWGNRFSPPYDWSGKDHPKVTTLLRDLKRRFQVDTDKVFLFGYGEGANFAMDVGCSHPDLFAGVALMCPTPNPDQFMHYWTNAQKLPFFIVTGEMAGSSPGMLRKVFEKWMPRGFPALLTMYRGRGMEWYEAELPRIFDWLGRKTRPRGTAALKLNAAVLEPWNIGRQEDNRFYWVGTTEVQTRYLMERGGFARGWVPAYISADLRQGNEIVVNTRGLRNAVIWLERDMIDWTRPVRVLVNGQPPSKYVPKVMSPDLALMFEELYRTGDRKMLFLGRLEFATP